MADVNAPAPVSAPAPGLNPDAVNSSHDIFAELDRKMGLSDEPTQDFSQTKKMEERPGTVEDLMGLGGDEEGAPEATSTPDESTSTDESVATEEPAAPAVNYKFKGKVGDKEYAFDVNSPEHMDRIIRKAIASDAVWKDHQKLRVEAEELRNHKAYLDRFESMLENSPEEVLHTIADEMGEEKLKEWLISKANDLSQPKEHRDLQKRLKQAEMMERKLAAIEAREAQIEEKRIQSARTNEQQSVKTWQDTWRQKLSAKIPEQYVDLVDDQLYNSIREAKERRANNETVTLKTLDQILARKMKPVLALINSTSGNTDREVGRALDTKKQQNLSRIQQAASSQAPAPKAKTRMQQMIDSGDISGIFDAFGEGVGSGRIKLG